MARNKYSLIDGQTKRIDGEYYEVCCFRNCTLVYDGGDPPQFSNCSFVGCTWRLGRVAVDGIAFMALFIVQEADELIDQLLYAMRRHPTGAGSPDGLPNEAPQPPSQPGFSLTI